MTHKCRHVRWLSDLLTKRMRHGIIYLALKTFPSTICSWAGDRHGMGVFSGDVLREHTFSVESFITFVTIERSKKDEEKSDKPKIEGAKKREKYWW